MQKKRRVHLFIKEGNLDKDNEIKKPRMHELKTYSCIRGKIIQRQPFTFL